MKPATLREFRRVIIAAVNPPCVNGIYRPIAYVRDGHGRRRRRRRSTCELRDRRSRFRSYDTSYSSSSSSSSVAIRPLLKPDLILIRGFIIYGITFDAGGNNDGGRVHLKIGAAEEIRVRMQVSVSA